MSEHWKSTPKYWCKHCSTYVKDTPFERNQHESTGKHQGNLKRFLTGIQKNHAKNEREKDQVKAEVDRLNRITGAAASSAPPTSATSTKPATAASSTKPSKSNLSATDQKRQWAQLAEMGIAVPDSARADIAMPGDWQTLSRKVISEPVDVVDDKLSIGVRKRKFEGEEEEEEAGEIVVRRGWGSTTKTYPGATSTSEGLDSLLTSSLFNNDNKKKKKMMMKNEEEENIGEISDVDTKKVTVSTTGSESVTARNTGGEEIKSSPVERIKSSEPVSVAGLPIEAQPFDENVNHVHAEGKDGSAPVFRKRRSKNKPPSSIT